MEIADIDMDEGEGNSPFSQLPAELKMKIFDNLRGRDLLSVSEVNHECHTLIEEQIGLDMQIGLLDSKWYGSTIYQNAIVGPFAALTIRTARSVTLGRTWHVIPIYADGRQRYCPRSMLEENMPDFNYHLALKQSELLKSVLLVGPSFPSHIEAILCNEIPIALTLLEINYTSLVRSMTDLLSRLDLPNLRQLYIQDYTVPVKGLIKRVQQQTKQQLLSIVNQNLVALLTVNFPRLKTFKLKINKSKSAFSGQERSTLFFACFDFLHTNRETLLDFTLIMNKSNNPQEQDQTDRMREIGQAANLEAIEISAHPGIQESTENALMAFFQGQRSLKKIAISTDIRAILQMVPIIAENNREKLTEVCLTCSNTRLELAQNVDLNSFLDCTDFANCVNLRRLTYKTLKRHKRWRAWRENGHEAKTLGFSPGLTNADYLPLTLEELNLESIALTKVDLISIVTRLVNLKGGILYATRLGSGFGMDTKIVKRIVKARYFDSVYLGYIIRVRLPRAGMPNFDPDLERRVIIRMPRQHTIMQLVKNEHGYYVLGDSQ